MSVAYVDVGQTGMRVDWGDGIVEIPRAGEPLSVPRAADRLATDLAASIPELDIVHVGATGIGSLEQAQGLVDELVARGARHVIVVSDRVSAYVGALGVSDGVVVVAGTGVVGFAVRGDRSATVGGAGWAIDDDGGGFSIGRAGLRAALRAHDGRGPETTLRDTAVERFGPPDEWQARIMEHDTPIAVVAGFARVVGEAARAGDVVAGSIWDDAATSLADVAQAAWRSAGGTEPAVIAITGGLVAAGPVLRERLSARVAAASLHFRADASLAGVRSLDDVRRRAAFRPYIASSEDP